MTEAKTELSRNAENLPQYGAIVVPSYGMSKDSRGYHLTYFSGVVCKAAYELWKDGVAPKVVIEGAKIFPNDPTNDGDLMHQFLLKLGMPEGAIIQRKDNTNTYNQFLDVKKTLEQEGIKGKVFTIYCDLHKYRVPKLLKNYGITSNPKADSKVAEDFLSEKYPAFKKAWEGYTNKDGKVWMGIKNDLSYKIKFKSLEAALGFELFFDKNGKLVMDYSNKRFAKKGADVPDIRHRKAVRSF